MTAPSTVTRTPLAPAAVERALLDELAVQQTHLAELQATVDDLTGQTDSDSMLEREVAERAIPRALDVIVDIERALRVIADATYGICEQCHDPIAPARLEAIPYVRHCVSCPPPPRSTRLEGGRR
jgi:RNA polymerase-binding transcription factor DksA